MMERFKLNLVKPTLMRVFNICFMIIFSYIFLNIIFQRSILWSSWHKPFIILSGALVLLFLLILLNKWLLKCSEKRLKMITGINFFLLFLIQLFCFRFFMVQPTWDFGAVLNLAIEGVHSSKGMAPYLYFMYPNNIPLYIFFMIVVKILSVIGVNDYLSVLIMINMLIVFLSAGLTYYLIFKRLHLKQATLFSFYMLLIVPFYLYTTIVYTDTLAMIFPILSAIIYMIYLDSKHSKRYLWIILLSVVLTVGILVKTNVVIMLVAILIHYLMTQKGLKVWLFCLLLIFPLLTINMGYKEVISRYSPLAKEEMGYPAVHWVLMGLKELPNRPGGFNQEIVDLTWELKSKGLTNKEIMEEEIDLIKEQLSEYGVQGYLDFLSRKINYTWGDGTYYAPKKLSLKPLDNNSFQAYVFGEKSETFVLFCQMVHVMNLLLIVIAAISLIKSTNQFEQLLTICLFGTFLFLLIWEARSRYLVLYVPIICVVSMYGFKQLNGLISRMKWLSR